MDAASQLAHQSLIVFVTAYDEYAIKAFERGALDYLLKPVDAQRLQQTCQRLKQTLDLNRRDQSQAQMHSKPALMTLPEQAAQVAQLIEMMQTSRAPEYLSWIQASVGSSLRMISCKEILFSARMTNIPVCKQRRRSF